MPDMNDVCSKCGRTYGDHKHTSDNCPNPEGFGFTNNVFTVMGNVVKTTIAGSERAYLCASIGDAEALQGVLEAAGYSTTVI